MKTKRFLLAIAFAIILFSSYAYSGDNTVTYGSQTYKTVKIGTQTWMAENLNYEAEGSKCYENNPDNCAKYGRLYNWETAMKVCPKGWHLPSNAEWDKLYRYADGTTGTESPYDSRSAGKHLKAAEGWNSYGGIENLDTHGFSALPGGGGLSGGSFYDVGYNGYWWSASEYGGYSAYFRGMGYGGEYAVWDDGVKSFLFSVRCLKD